MPDPVRTGPVSLRWKDADYGEKNRALYAGSFCVGRVTDTSSFQGWCAILYDVYRHEIGRYPTEAEAKAALLAAVIEELGK